YTINLQFTEPRPPRGSRPERRAAAGVVPADRRRSCTAGSADDLASVEKQLVHRRAARADDLAALKRREVSRPGTGVVERAGAVVPRSPVRRELRNVEQTLLEELRHA